MLLHSQGVDNTHSQYIEKIIDRQHRFKKL